MPSTRIIMSSSFKNCWLPARVLSHCLPCQRYDTCSYPEREHHHAFDALRARRAALMGEVKQLDDKMSKLQNGQVRPE